MVLRLSKREYVGIVYPLLKLFKALKALEFLLIWSLNGHLFIVILIPPLEIIVCYVLIFKEIHEHG